MVRPYNLAGTGREPNQTRAARCELGPQMLGVNPSVRTQTVVYLHIAALGESHLVATTTDLVPPPNNRRADHPDRHKQGGDANSHHNEKNDQRFPIHTAMRGLVNTGVSSFI